MPTLPWPVLHLPLSGLDSLGGSGSGSDGTSSGNGIVQCTFVITNTDVVVIFLAGLPAKGLHSGIRQEGIDIGLVHRMQTQHSKRTVGEGRKGAKQRGVKKRETEPLPPRIDQRFSRLQDER